MSTKKPLIDLSTPHRGGLVHNQPLQFETYKLQPDVAWDHEPEDSKHKFEPWEDNRVQEEVDLENFLLTTKMALDHLTPADMFVNDPETFEETRELYKADYLGDQDPDNPHRQLRSEDEVIAIAADNVKTRRYREAEDWARQNPEALEQMKEQHETVQGMYRDFQIRYPNLAHLPGETINAFVNEELQDARNNGRGYNFNHYEDRKRLVNNTARLMGLYGVGAPEEYSALNAAADAYDNGRTAGLDYAAVQQRSSNNDDDEDTPSQDFNWFTGSSQ